MYSLVSASVLALDLARHPSGAAVADTVDRVLCLTASDLEALAAAAGPEPARAAARARVLGLCASAPRMSAALRGVGSAFSAGLPGPAQSRVLLETLDETLIGGLDDLQAMLLREEPLAGDRPAGGVQVALDAVAVAWAGRAVGVELGELALLRAPWAAALSPVTSSLPADGFAGRTGELRALLDEVSRAGADTWGRVEQAHWARSGGLGWSQAMHEASRAAVDADRLVDVARAQLAAARVLRLSGVSTGAQAQAVGMAVTAAVQATCVLDVLDRDCADVLLHAWQTGRVPSRG